MRDDAAGFQRLFPAWKAIRSALIIQLVNGPGRPPLPNDAEALLVSEMRARIYALIQAQPGLSASEVKRGLDLGGGSVHHHMARLEEAGLIESREIAGRRRFYPLGAAPTPREEVLEHETRRRAARAVVRRPGLSSREVAEELGLSKRAATEHLGRLVEAGWIRTEGRGRSIRYFPAGKLVARRLDEEGTT